MAYEPRRRSIKAKYLRIQQRFKELYDVQRLRYDDCIERIQKEFFIEHPNTVTRILSTTVILEPEPDTAQLSLFE